MKGSMTSANLLVLVMLVACATSVSAGGPPRLAPSGAAGASQDSDYRINDLPEGDQAEISIAADTRGNLYAGWIDARVSPEWGGGCGFARSTDGGLTWGPTEIFIPPEQKAGNDPVIAADEAGNLYRMCMGVFGPGPFPHYHSRSADGGATWTPWVKGLNGDKPWMAARAGALYKVWTYGGTLNFSKSLDGGDTWSPAAPIGVGLGGCIAVGSNGVLHAAHGLQTIGYIRSDDDGATWSKTVALGTGNGVVGGGSPGAPVRASVASCAVGPAPKDVYVSWAGANNRSGGSTEWDIWSAHSGDGGATWEPASRVNDEGRNGVIAFNQGMAVDRAGVVHVAWVDDRNGVQEAFYSNSTDKGRTWSANIHISKAAPAKGWNQWAGHYNQMVVLNDGHVGFGYSDQRDSNPDVWFSRIRAAAPQRLARIDVSPPQANITADETVRFAAAGFDQGGAPMSISPVWGGSGGAVDPVGLFTPSATGTFTVSASDRGVTGTATVSVRVGVLALLSVQPSEVTITVDETQSFSARGADAKGNPIPAAPGWSASGGTVDANGHYSPDELGGFTVTASASGLSADAKVTVVPGEPAAIVVEPARVVTSAVRTVKLYATAVDRVGTPLPQIDGFFWTVEGPIGSLSSTDGAQVSLHTDNPFWAEGVISVRLDGLSAKVPVTVRGSPYPIDKDTTPGDFRSRGDGGFLGLYPSFVLFWAALLIAAFVAGLAWRWRRGKRRSVAFARATGSGDDSSLPR